MNTLVCLSPNTNEPFTTSEVIAEFAQVEHHTITRIIRNYKADFELFGILGFEIQEIKTKRGTKYAKNYILNEQQATLLMTYLRNTEVVRNFKVELVRQFALMRQELERIKAIKQDRKQIRRNVTDAIAALPETPHKAMKYAQYTNLAYKAAVGMTARELRQDRGAPKTATASNYMTSAELEAVADAENKIGVLLDAGFAYAEIKDYLMRGTAQAPQKTTT